MGRASQRKRSRASAPRPVTPSARPRRRLMIAGVVAAAIALSLGAWFLYRGAGAPPSPRPSVGLPDPDTVGLPDPATVGLPDPDTSGMTPPVARAIHEARRAALARPESAAAVGRFGQVLHAHWLLDAAAACYEIARGLAPENFRWVYLLAIVEDIRGADGERIDQLFREATRLALGFPQVYVRRADALLRLGRWSEARDAYAAAVERGPELILAHRGLGQATLLLGDGPAAVEHLERAARLMPEDRIAQVALARAYTLVNQDDKAAEAVRKAETLTAEAPLPDPIFFAVRNLAVDPETLRGRTDRGLREGAYEAAIEALTLLGESVGGAVNGQLAFAHKQRANKLAFSGDFDAALAEFERAARLAPTDPEIEHNWGTVLLRRDDFEEAGRHFEKAIELNPRSAESLYNLGGGARGAGTHRRGRRTFHRGRGDQPAACGRQAARRARRRC